MVVFPVLASGCADADPDVDRAVPTFAVDRAAPTDADEGVPTNVDRAVPTDADQDAAVRMCVDDGFMPTDEYEGLDEATAVENIVANDDVVRVIGQDGDCNGRTEDLRNDRVNLYLQNGRVIWAGRG